MDGTETRLDTLVIQVKADTSGFLNGVTALQRSVEGPLAAGVERAGGAMERSLARAVVRGRLGFEDLRRVALNALADIAAAAFRADLGGLLGGGGPGLLGGLLLGPPGRATGGPVVGGRAYLVGERGPELFVPQASGRVAAVAGGNRGPVTVNVHVAVPREAGPAVMAQTGAQLARAVRRALMAADQ